MTQTLQQGWDKRQGMSAALRSLRAARVEALTSANVKQMSERRADDTASRSRMRGFVRRMAAGAFRVARPILRPLMWRTRDYLAATQLDALQRIEVSNAELRARVERLEIAMLNYSERSRLSTEDLAAALDSLTRAVTSLQTDLGRER